MYERFIRQIFPVYRNRIVLHEHYELVKKYRLHGIHLKYPQANEYIYYIQQYAVSISCHRVDEIRQLPFRPAYCFLSPISIVSPKRDTGADSGNYRTYRTSIVL